MDLDVIRKLNKEDLMKIVGQSGYVDIARILGELNLSGFDLLDVTEFQTINWKTTPIQRKQLLAFIKQLKANPSLLKTFLPIPSKPKPQPFISPKSQPFKSPKPQPSTSSKPQPSTSSKPQPLTSPKPGISFNKRPIHNLPSKFPSVKTETTSVIGDKQAFKQQLHLIEKNNKTNQQQGNALILKKGKMPLPNPDLSNYNQDNGRYMLMGKSQPFVNNDDMEEEEELYENAKTFESGRRTNGSDNYKAHQEPLPTNLDDVYEPPPMINIKKNISPLPRNYFPVNLKVEEVDGNDYEQISNERQVLQKIWNTPSSSKFHKKISIDLQKSHLHDEDDFEPALIHHLGSSVSPGASRKPIPTPIRENVRKMSEKKDNSNHDYLSLLPPHIDKTSNDGNSATSNDRNINRSKFNYEIHLMKNENQITRIRNVGSICNRPLPEIPNADLRISLQAVDPQSSSTLNRNWRTCVKSPGYLETTRNRNANEQKSSGYVVLAKNNEGNCYPNDDEANQVYLNFDEANDSDEPDVPLAEYKINPPTLVSRDQQTHNQQKTTAADLVNKLISELSARNTLMKQQDMNDQLAGNTPKMGKFRGNSPVTPPSTSNKENFKISKSPLPKPPPIYGIRFPVARCPSGGFSDESDEEPEKNIFNINSEPYYRNTDRKGAKLLLSGLEDGAFLFRPSQRYFLVLTLKYNKKTYNLGIQRTKRDKIKLVADTESEPPEFSTLQDFVDHFTMEAVTFQDGEQLIEVCLKTVLPTNLF